MSHGGKRPPQSRRASDAGRGGPRPRGGATWPEVSEGAGQGVGAGRTRAERVCAGWGRAPSLHYDVWKPLKGRTRHPLWARQEYKTGPLRQRSEGLGLPLALAGRVSPEKVPDSPALLPERPATSPERVCAAPLSLGSRWRDAPLSGAASGPFSFACGAACGVTAMASGVWRRQTLERCLGEVGKATGRPECFLT